MSKNITCKDTVGVMYRNEFLKNSVKKYPKVQKI